MAILLLSGEIEKLKQCCECLAHQSFSDFHVILLDWSDKPKVSSAVTSTRLFPNGRIHLVPAVGTTASQAWNIGLRHIDRELCDTPKFVGFLNEQSCADPDWLKELVSSAEHCDERTGMFASKLAGPKRKCLRSLGHTLVPWGKPDRAYQKRFDHELPGEPLCPCQAAALYRWSLIKDVQSRGEEEFVDEDLEHYWNCFDSGIKARVLGWRCKLVPSAIVEDVGFSCTSSNPPNPNSKRIQQLQGDRLALTLKFVPDDQLPDAIIRQLTESTVRMLARGEGRELAEALERIGLIYGRLMKKRSRWSQFGSIHEALGLPPPSRTET